MAITPDITNPPPEETMLNESVLIEQLGIPLKKMRALRPASVDVRTADGVFWPLAEAVALAVSVGGVLKVTTEKNAPADEGETLTVVRRAPNPLALYARRSNGEVVTVRVSNNRNFYPTLRLRSATGGSPDLMSFKARRADTGNHWVMLRKEPRYPGQW